MAVISPSPAYLTYPAHYTEAFAPNIDPDNVFMPLSNVQYNFDKLTNYGSSMPGDSNEPLAPCSTPDSSSEESSSDDELTSATEDTNSLYESLSQFRFRRIETALSPPPLIDNLFDVDPLDSLSNSSLYSAHPDLAGTRSDSPGQLIPIKRPRRMERTPTPPPPLQPIADSAPISNFKRPITLNIIDLHPQFNRRSMMTIEVLNPKPGDHELPISTYHFGQVASYISTDSRYRRGLTPTNATPAGYDIFTRIFNSVAPAQRGYIWFAQFDYAASRVILDGKAPKLIYFRINPFYAYPSAEAESVFARTSRAEKAVRLGPTAYSEHVLPRRDPSDGDLSMRRFQSH